MLYTELKRFVDQRNGPMLWPELLSKAGLSGTNFVPTRHYPDEQLTALVGAAAEVTSIPTRKLLEDFGEFIAPDLLALYSALTKPHWRTLELLLNTEDTIHRIVRIQNPEASPPFLTCIQTGPDRVVVTYTSARRLCAVGRGIIKGLAREFKERVAIDEPVCMLQGGQACELHVRILSAGVVGR